MLLNYFKAAGFKVFGQPVEINLVPRTKNYQSLRENIIIEGSSKNNKVSLLYGGNNTGKSSLLDALLAFKSVVQKGDVEDFPFDVLKNFCNETKNISFELSIRSGKLNITYGIEFNENLSIGEYVFSNEELLVSREITGEIEGSIIDNNTKLKDRITDLPNKKLILTYINEYVTNPNTNVFSEISRFFTKIEFLNESKKEQIVSREIIEFMSDERKVQLLNKLIETTELYVEKREFAEEDYVIQNEYYKKYFNKQLIDKMKNGRQIDGLRMVSYYKDKNGNSTKRPSVLFDSVGTNKYLITAIYVINAILNEQILLIDEIDSSLHYKLTRLLIILMNSPLNKQAQFIITTHDVKLLSPQLFRKDQINFIIRNSNQVSVISLDDFKANSDNDIRSDSNFEKMYTEERIVDLPVTNITKFINETKELWQK